MFVRRVCKACGGVGKVEREGKWSRWCGVCGGSGFRRPDYAAAQGDGKMPCGITPMQHLVRMKSVTKVLCEGCTGAGLCNDTSGEGVVV